MKSKVIVIISVFMIFSGSLKAQIVEDSVNWMSFDSVRVKFKEFQKPVLIFLYSEDSDSSKLMQTETFSNTEVASYINFLFYPIKFDINSKDTIVFFDGQEYANSSESKSKHDMVYMFTGNTDTVPALVLFDKTAKGQSFYGFKNRDEIFRVLIYYAEQIGQGTSYEDWLIYHKKAYPPGQEQIMTRLKVDWLKPAEAMELQKVKPKKMLFYFYDYRSISGTVMRTQIFNSKKVSDYIRDKYYMVNIDVFTKDTLRVFGRSYINENKPHEFHQLPVEALAGYMKFPAFIILDEDHQVREKFHKFFTVEKLFPILKFYGDDIYKNETWEDFLRIYNRMNLQPED